VNKLFTCRLVVSVPQTTNNEYVFVIPESSFLSTIVRNGSISKEDFYKHFRQINDDLNTEPEKEFKYLENIGRPFGPLPFYKALAACIKGQKIARTGWNGRNMFISHYSVKDTDPFSNDILTITNSDNSVSPWAPSQSDQLACDWFII